MEIALLHSTGRHEGGEGGDGWREKHIEREWLGGVLCHKCWYVCLCSCLQKPQRKSINVYGCTRKDLSITWGLLADSVKRGGVQDQSESSL